jgi:hypothetical protein
MDNFGRIRCVDVRVLFCVQSLDEVIICEMCVFLIVSFMFAYLDGIFCSIYCSLIPCQSVLFFVCLYLFLDKGGLMVNFLNELMEFFMHSI